MLNTEYVGTMDFKLEEADHYFLARCHEQRHHADLPCQKRRTGHPGGKAGSGSPLGFLAAWLLSGAKHECTTRDRHVHGHFNPRFKERNDARDLLKQQPGYADLASHEDGDGDEEPQVFTP